MKYFTFLPLLCGVIYFVHCFFISIVLKSVGNLFILVNSGFHSHGFQYTQNAHTGTCEHSLYLGKPLQFVED